MIQLSQVSKKYEKQLALDNISLSIPIGKIIGIVGSNGSGKSTLLKLIAGLSLPSSGLVTVNGDKASRRTSQYVSYLSEIGSYYTMFTVREAMDFQASQYTDFHLTKAEEIMTFMQLEPTMRIRNLSKGQRGRFKMMLTLARNVPYILMDEPLSGLDPMVRAAIVQGMISYVDLDYQTLVMTSHDIVEIESLLDCFIALQAGKLLRVADMDELHGSDGLRITDWMKKNYA